MNCSIDARRVKTDLITFANIYIRKSDARKNIKSLALIRKYGPFCSIESYNELNRVQKQVFFSCQTKWYKVCVNSISIGLSCPLERPDFWIVPVSNKKPSVRRVRVRLTVWEIASHYQELHYNTDEVVQIARQMTISSCSINRWEIRWFKMYTIANNNCWHCTVYCKMWVIMIAKHFTFWVQFRGMIRVFISITGGFHSHNWSDQW